MHLTLDVVRARKGDCLLVHHGTKKSPRLILVDGGPSAVYQPHLKPRLMAIRAARKIADADPLPLDLVMLSHIDDDHIQGLLDLTSELREQQGDHQPLLVEAASLWHNSFDDLLDTVPEELKAEASFGAAAVSGKVDVGDKHDMDVAKVLASIPQGRQLRDDAKALAWPPNRAFKGGLIIATAKGAPVKLTTSLKITVVGPMKAQLQALQAEHDAFL